MTRKRQIPSDILARGRAREKARERAYRKRMRAQGIPVCTFPDCTWPEGIEHDHLEDLGL